MGRVLANVVARTRVHVSRPGQRVSIGTYCRVVAPW